MRLRLDRLLKPVDPVVAVHRESRDADDSLAVLRRAGFRRDNLTVVGQSNTTIDVARMTRHRDDPSQHWAASGFGLGLLWAAFTTLAVVLHRSGGTAFVVLAAAGASTLLLQAIVMRRVVALEQGPVPGHPAVRRLTPGDTHPPQAWQFLVVVHGTRSDVALARDLLASR